MDILNSKLQMILACNWVILCAVFLDLSNDTAYLITKKGRGFIDRTDKKNAKIKQNAS